MRKVGNTMKYDFTSIIERRGMDALAIDGPGVTEWCPPVHPQKGFDLIPMWVADMNFATCPTIPKAIIERAEHPLYGYFDPREEYYDAIIRWQEKRNGVTRLTPECIGYENGVLGGVISALNTLCSRGDKVLLHSPTYVGFTHSLGDNGYQIIHSPLIKDENGVWRMDYEDMEQKIIKHNIHATVFCSPHNPSGRVWEAWELEKAFALFAKYDVFVISDEIWSDLTLPDYQHIPSQSVSEDARNRTIALYAPSKTFNLAGLIGSYHIIYNKRLRDRVNKESALCHYNSMNVLSMHALLGAYRPEGEEWVEELKQTLAGNIDYAYDYIRKNFSGVTLTKPQGTYLLFLDCTEWCEKHSKSLDKLLQAGWDVGVAWQDGRDFNGPCHIRMNLALPFSRVQEAFERLKQYVFVD